MGRGARGGGTELEIVSLHSARVDKSPNPNGGQGLRRSSITVYLSKAEGIKGI